MPPVQLSRARRTPGRRALIAALALLAALPGSLLAQDRPGSAAALVEAARAAAREDRNAESAELYGRALDLEPALRRDLLRLYADQLTYGGRSVEAVPLFEEVLAWDLAPDERRRAKLGLALALSWSEHHDEALRVYEDVLGTDPENVEARLGRARMLSWRGRLGEARDAYEEILSESPGNLEARRSLAQVQGWRHRHGEALARLEGILTDHPDDLETLLILARVRSDQGRPDLARSAVERLLSLRPDHVRAVEFRQELLGRARPESRLELQRSTQTDDLVIASLALTHTLHLDDGLTTLELRLRRTGFDRAGFTPSAVDLTRPGLHVRRRAGDRTEVNLSVQGDVIHPRAPLENASPLVWDGWLTWWPADALRLDLSSQRSTFDDIRSLVEPVVATTFGLSADLTPDERGRLSVRGSRGDYSDGNGRWWAQLEGEWRAHAAPDVRLGARVTSLRFDAMLHSGYFNPQRYTSGVATLRAWKAVAGRTWVDLGGSWGRERSEPGGARPLWTLDARVTRRFGTDTEVEARFDVFSSRSVFSLESEADGGWARRTAAVQVRRVW